MTGHQGKERPRVPHCKPIGRRSFRFETEKHRQKSDGASSRNISISERIRQLLSNYGIV